MIKSNKSDNLRVSIGESLMSSVHMWVVQSPMVRKILGSWGWRCKVLTGPKWASNWDMIRSATILARRLQLKTIPDSHVRVYFILKNHFLSIPSIKNSKFYLVGSRPGICWASKDRIPYNRPIRRNRDFVRDPGTWHRWAHSTSAYPTTKPNRTVSVWCCKTNAAKQMLQKKCCKTNAAKQILQKKCGSSSIHGVYLSIRSSGKELAAGLRIAPYQRMDALMVTDVDGRRFDGIESFTDVPNGDASANGSAG